MAEVLAEFADVLIDDHGVRYHALACGAEMADGRWHGWLEFVPLDGEVPIRSERETTQPNRQDTIYWSTGLSPVYLEGALQRALKPRTPVAPPPRPSVRAGVPGTPAAHAPAPHPTHDAILNPFSVYEKGETLLRRQLTALSAWHLVNIVEAYHLSDEPASHLNRFGAPQLVELIVSEVVARAARW